MDEAADGESFFAVPSRMAWMTSNFTSRPSLPVPRMDAGSSPSERTRNITAGDSCCEADEEDEAWDELVKERKVEERERVGSGGGEEAGRSARTGSSETAAGERGERHVQRGGRGSG